MSVQHNVRHNCGFQPIFFHKMQLPTNINENMLDSHRAHILREKTIGQEVCFNRYRQKLRFFKNATLFVTDPLHNAGTKIQMPIGIIVLTLLNSTTLSSD